MCGHHDHSNQTASSSRGPPDHLTLDLPPVHVLRHLTDAHCHPTDLDYAAADYDAVEIGALAAMATDVENQDKVRALGRERAWKTGAMSAGRRGIEEGSSIVSCFGYHPWFVHRYTLEATPPTKEQHYLSLFFSPKSSPTSKDRLLLASLLPYLPDPVPFEPLLQQLRSDISDSLQRGNLTMLGEVGIDGQARMRWPTHPQARAIYEQQYGNEKGKRDGDDDNVDWRRLTPFKTNLQHQKRILELQMGLAIELGVNASVHSVAAPGATLDVLVDLRKKHGVSFSSRTNICIHSAGGWSPEFWRGAARQLPNLYGSPSILITGRVAHADALIAAIDRDRILIESDSHDVKQMTRLLWGAAEWVARSRGWKLEGSDTDEWEMQEEEERYGSDGRVVVDKDEETWTVRTLERNWARFMRLVD